MTNVEQILINTPSTPIVNLEVDREFTLSYLELCRDLHGRHWNGKRLDLVKIHKVVFGRQQYCWNGEFRNWVWEFGEGIDLLRIFINNTQGISVEVSERTSRERAIELFEKYKSSILGK